MRLHLSLQQNEPRQCQNTYAVDRRRKCWIYTGTPWLKVNSNYTDINVKNQEADAHSVLNYYRKLIVSS